MANFNDLSIDTDIEEIDKFKNRFLENDRHFLVIFLLKMNLDIVFQKVYLLNICAPVFVEKKLLSKLYIH